MIHEEFWRDDFITVTMESKTLTKKIGNEEDFYNFIFSGNYYAYSSNTSVET